jgi:geranylgeranyl diphosphate synthase type II
MNKPMIKEQIANYGHQIESYFQVCLQDAEIPEQLRKSMHYSLVAGGKRIRPVLCLAVAKMLGCAQKQVMPFAVGLEFIHTYSLVHDDLPAMDNDDLRRGKPTNHKVYGEALAILAGDGLQSEAFSLMLQAEVPAECLIRALSEIARDIGPRGMVGGQVLDMALTGSGSNDLEALKKMHSLKTAELIKGSCLSGALLAHAAENDLERIAKYGSDIGLAFQIADDILDVIGEEKNLGKTVGSDQDQGKVTYPELLGIEKSRKWGMQLVEDAHSALSIYAGQEAEFLRDLARYIMERVE